MKSKARSHFKKMVVYFIGRNQRDYAPILDLIILNNLEFLDAMLLQWDCDKEERKSILQEAYDFQYPILKRSKTIQHLQEIANNMGNDG